MNSQPSAARSKTFAIIGIAWGAVIVLFSLSQGGPQGSGFYFFGQCNALVLGLAMVAAGIYSLATAPTVALTTRDESAAQRDSRRRRRAAWLVTTVVLLLDLGIAVWMGITIQRIEDRKEMLRGIKPRFATTDPKLGQPSWHRQLVGQDDIGFADIADFTHARVTDEEMPLVASLHQLRLLILPKSDITDAGLSAIQDMPNLEFLALPDTRVTDAGMEHLRRFPQLKRLDLRRTKITDAGLRRIAELPNLRVLLLAETRVTDTGMSYIGKLVELEELNLNGTSVGDVGLQHLKPLQNLKILRLQATRVRDEGLVLAPDLKSLKQLDLQGTLLSDSVINVLRGCAVPHIRIGLPNSVSDDAVNELRTVLPNASITRSNGERSMW